MKYIYNIEHRDGDKNQMECVSFAMFSKLESAIEWIKYHKTDTGWYVIFKEELDPDITEGMPHTEMLKIFSKDAIELTEQPL